MMHKGRIAAEGTEEELAARLRHGRRLELEVSGEEAPLRQALSQVAEASDVGVSRTPHGTLKATLRVDDVARERVSRAVVQAGLGLLGMQASSTGLETIFLELSGAQGDRSVPPPAASSSAGGAA
jgi:ABC-2 type transport system ATP-binding protein